MRDEFYDNEWVPEPAKELTAAAEVLERFAPDAPMEPRTAFLMARWLRSYGEQITTRARAERETPEVDEHALELARHIIGESK